jgi:hypothetical protein
VHGATITELKLETARLRIYTAAMQKLADGPTGHLTIQLLTWLAESPRSYGEAMEAWRTHCPRMPIWEDALRDGLIRLEPGASMREKRVSLTLKGAALLKTSALMDS